MKGPKGKHAWTAKVGERGQIVIPSEARKLFGIEPGDTVLILGDEKKGLAIVNGSKFNMLLGQLMGAQEEETEDAGD